LTSSLGDLLVQLRDPAVEERQVFEQQFEDGVRPQARCLPRRSVRPGLPGEPLLSPQSSQIHIPAQRVDDPGALPNEEITSSEYRHAGLLLLALYHHVPHVRTLRRLANCLRINRVVLLPLYKGLDIRRRNQPDRVAQLDQLARPMVRAATCIRSPAPGDKDVISHVVLLSSVET
jgi:hypothetical protein